MASKPAFGVLPLQRTPMEEAIKILRKAYDAGITFYDTANAYTDSEEKIGNALSDVRHNIIIATKSGATDRETVTKHIENSLKMLKTDYIDIFQFHNPAVLPDPSDENGAYAAALAAKEKGYIRHIGITNHRIAVALQAVESGNFETVQFPFSYLADEKEIDLVKRCKEADIGFIAMKGLCGGMLDYAPACHYFMEQYDNVVPIWGIQHEWELDQWLALAEEEAVETEEIRARIARDKVELAGNFCRSCGYCLPCPAHIDIPQAGRMAMLLRRSPYQRYVTEEYYAEMHKIDDCIHCNHCKNHCPYGLDTPNLLKEMLADYDQFYAEHHHEVVKD